MDSCDECGFVYGALPTGEIAERLRAAPSRFGEALSGVAATDLRRRPSPEVWSALEYTCHVRDVILVQRDRAVLALVEDRPSFARMHREERVGLCRYDADEPEEVLNQLGVAAHLCALVFSGLASGGPGGSADGAWSRPLVYNWPEPATFDLGWLGRHTIHEVEHHLRDVRSLLAP